MAQRKPVVMNNGQLEQLQPGDYLQQIELAQFLNDNAGAIVIGTPVYSSGNDSVNKAQANAVGTVNVIGLVADASISAASTGAVQTDGILSATTTQWDAVAGTTGGLTKDVIYYLDATTAGKITSVAPSTLGQYVKEVGMAISTTELRIAIKGRIKL